ncbi:hypothetical protein DSM25558_1677 [Agrobacterium sp. DSM 25558]|uniref:BrnT family toxin n=1 Tax=Agrobacterium sp. DSM 25558 TaxID=1907665 RepID=UPI0009726307|nr:BrnT family toxin [Agrobacterium sp. DSM 25558]SCX13079.1 hypothetical protein DSM25558_1677 [Agrobacterium sp. DSM 25558]
MKIIWDEPKRLANIDKHGFDFADIGEFDWGNAIVEESLVSERNQRRFKAVGYFREGTAAVIFATLGAEAISIVSFRQASEKERRRLPWPRP